MSTRLTPRYVDPYSDRYRDLQPDWRNRSYRTRKKAFRLLRSKLYDLELEKRRTRKRQNAAARSVPVTVPEKIRTYNFPQGRVTEHRIKLTLYKIDSIMDGDLYEIIDSLIAADQAAKLAKMNEGI